MLDSQMIEAILAELPNKTIGLVGDLFLDRYLDIDAALTEPSLETGLDAYQVAGVRSYPGAMGTVINNLAALGVGKIVPISFIGDDGEGYELLQALQALKVVELEGIFRTRERRTPTYCKPMLREPGMLPRELNRLDTKNRKPTPQDAAQFILDRIGAFSGRFDALLIVDQVSEANCGVITDGVRDHLIEYARRNPNRFILADSRELIPHFKNMWIKPNEKEQQRLGDRTSAADESEWHRRLAVEYRGLFLTAGKEGIEVICKRPGEIQRNRAAAYPVAGPIDIVGAGDSCSAAIGCAMACGCDPFTAAQFGNLIASITIQQIGVTGTASPEQVRKRWAEVGK